MTTVVDAFRWARIHADRHIAACEQAGIRWGETSITEIVTARAAKAVTVVPFSQRAEALSGADWIWWWEDGSDAYGMLVQAKRVTVKGGKWSFGFDYKVKGTGRSQRDMLHSTAVALGLLPTYALYLGTGDSRGWRRCSDDHRSGRCLQCVKRTISLMPALLADTWFVNDAMSTYERSVALEEIWVPGPAGAPLIPAMREQLAPKLLDFLQERQDGTRAVARSMIDRVLTARSGQLSGVSAPGQSARYEDHERLGPIFGDVPDDTGHWGLNYFSHTLNPLRLTPPGYVLEITTGDFDADDFAADMPDNVAGVVVVRVPQQE